MNKLRAGTRLGAVSQDDAAQHDEREVRAVLGLIDPDGPERLPISKIRRDGGTQPRAELNQDTIADYAEDMARGDQFPPGIVFYDGTDYWLVRGFTRTAAAELLGWTEFDYIVKQGARRDAILFSLGENADHGLRRTNEDKRRVVLVMLNDPEWSSKSSQYIADCCHVSHTFVDKIRLSPATVAGQGKQGKKKPETRIGADGREIRIDRIQKAAQKRAAQKPKLPPPEPVRHPDESEPSGDWQNRPAQPRGLYQQQVTGEDWTARVSIEKTLTIEIDERTTGEIRLSVIEHLEAAVADLEQLDLEEDARSLRDYVRERRQEWGLK